MNLRAFITGLGAAAWPLAARAQQGSSLPLIGYLGAGSPDPFVCMLCGTGSSIDIDRPNSN